MYPVEIRKTLLWDLDKLVLRELGNEANTDYGNPQL